MAALTHPDVTLRNKCLNLKSKALLKGKWGSKTHDSVIYDLMILVVNINGSQFLYRSIYVLQKFMNRSGLVKRLVFPKQFRGVFYHIHHLYSWIPYATVWFRKQLRGHDSTGGGTRLNDSPIKWSDLFGIFRGCVEPSCWFCFLEGPGKPVAVNFQQLYP